MNGRCDLTTINLACKAGHDFECWFRSLKDFEKQLKAQLVVCPWCGASEITRRPSVPHVIRSSRERKRSPALAAIADAAAELQRLHTFVQNNCEDVGDRFAEEARRRHEDRLDEETYASAQGGADEGAATDESLPVENTTKENANSLSTTHSASAAPAGKTRRAKTTKGIYGKASQKEIRSLHEDGIAVSALPPLPSSYN